MPPSTPQYSPYGAQQYNGPPPQQQQYQYSQCTGRKKALCIGINYFGQDSELCGCINDAKNMKAFLLRKSCRFVPYTSVQLNRCVGRFGYNADDIVMLLDDATNPRQMPTRQNIVSLMLFRAG
jgi:metacaspase-1